MTSWFIVYEALCKNFFVFFYYVGTVQDKDQIKSNQYAYILQLIWPIIDTDTDICIFFSTPNCRDHQVSSVVELTYSIIVHTLTVLACRQM